MPKHGKLLRGYLRTSCRGILARKFAGSCPIAQYVRCFWRLIPGERGLGIFGADSTEEDLGLILPAALRFGNCALKWGDYDNPEIVVLECGVVCPGIGLVLLNRRRVRRLR